MKKTIFFFLFSLVITGVWAQTSLPTSFTTFSSPLPTGWTYLNNNGGATTYASGSDDLISCRLDGTGEYLQIFFSDVPGVLTYYMKGTATSAPAFTGSFTVEESIDGTTWTTLQNFTSMNSAFTLYTNNVTSTSRYVRFFYTTKVSGSNVALDQVSLTKAVLPIDINVKQGATNIINGGTFSIGTSASTIFNLENLGASGTLNISSSPITGADAANFSVTGMAASVAAAGTSTFTVNFAPTGAIGTKNATLTINSNDPNDPAYVINLIGINGTAATEPTAQATSLNFTNVKSYTFNAAFTAASPAAENYIVLIKRGAPFTSEQPVDATTYLKGQYIGAAQVAYIGNGTSFTPNFIVANTNYYIKVFSFNGPAGFENYLTTNPLSGTTTSSDGNVGTTYSGVSTSSASFVTQLHNKVYPHTQIYYSNYAPNMISNGFESRDTVDAGVSKTAVTCHYTTYNYVYAGAFSWTPSGTLTREHSYCFSWMPASITADSVPYSDLHNLFPVEFTNANAKRSNYPLGVVVTPTFSWNGGKLGLNASGQTCYEPKDSEKGDAARAILYMAICYTGTNGNLWALPSTQDQNVLKLWNQQDPPSNWEIARNDYIAWKQGNRNPFVDSAQYVCYINFSNMTYISNPGGNCASVGISQVENNTSNTVVYPNPTSGNFNVEFTAQKQTNYNVKLIDFTGKLIRNINYTTSIGENKIDVSVSDYPSGIYLLQLSSEGISKSYKIVKN
ncbi:MAG: endonuclease [Bacteroidetes bacterium]|nr:endonuclease [Bacteroidota bacterium]